MEKIQIIICSMQENKTHDSFWYKTRAFPCIDEPRSFHHFSLCLLYVRIEKGIVSISYEIFHVRTFQSHRNEIWSPKEEPSDFSTDRNDYNYLQPSWHPHQRKFHNCISHTVTNKTTATIGLYGLGLYELIQSSCGREPRAHPPTKNLHFFYSRLTQQ